MVLGGVKSGSELVYDALRIVWHYPKFLVPIGAVWVVIASVTIWQRFFFDPTGRSAGFLLAFAFATIFLFATLLVFCCAIQLEMIQQVERAGEEPHLLPATRATLHSNVGSLLGIALIWSIVWFVLTLIEALFEDDETGNQDYSPEAAVETMAGGNGSLLSLSIDALKKGIRMLVFLVLPAVVWEGRGLRDALDRGYEVFRANIVAFATGFTLTMLVTAVVFLPAGALLWLSDEGLIQLSATQWYLVLLYVGFAWSVSIYLEQLFTADLFLWHIEWEQAVAAAAERDEPVPELRDVPRPSLLDDVSSLSERKLPGGEAAPLVEDAGGPGPDSGV